MKDVLQQIIAHKKREIEEAKKRHSIDEFLKIIENRTVEFHSLKTALQNSPTGIIAEFKRRSPSKGWINERADATIIPQQYEKNGAAAVSVLTDENYFGGTLTDLKTARKNVSIPLLRKEFIVDEFQVYEAKAAGADTVLLIAAALSPQTCRRFTELALSLQLDVLLELHDENEIEYISPLNSIIGVNNRNLGSFVTDVEKSFRLIDLLPKEAVLVSESGISSPETVESLRDAGYKGFLIGENFMKTDNPGESLGIFIDEIERK